MATKEKSLINNILLKVGASVKIFRNNVAFSWQGRKVRDYRDKDGVRVIVLKGARPINSGLTKGASDLIGWTKVKVTEEMVGKEIAVFTAIEAKTPSVSVSKDQQNFIKVIESDGGFAGIARSVEDAITITGGEIETTKEETTNESRPRQNTKDKGTTKTGRSSGQSRRRTKKSGD